MARYAYFFAALVFFAAAGLGFAAACAASSASRARRKAFSRAVLASVAARSFSISARTDLSRCSDAVNTAWARVCGSFLSDAPAITGHYHISARWVPRETRIFRARLGP